MPTTSARANRGNDNRELKWQEEKSLQTRHSIMEAAISCFVELGYTNTTMQKICETAGLSRGAMMHHFASRDAVIHAAVEYLHDKRIEEFEQLVEKLARRFNGDDHPTEEQLSKTVRVVWQYFNLPSYTAVHELTVAARTNAALETTLRPVLEALDDHIGDCILELFPYWKTHDATREFLQDLIFFTLQGMAISYFRTHRKARTEQILDALTRHTVEEFRQARNGAK